MYCNNCGKQLKENAKFCSNCGSSVNSNNTGNDKTSAQEKIFSQKGMPEEEIKIYRKWIAMDLIGIISVFVMLWNVSFHNEFHEETAEIITIIVLLAAEGFFAIQANRFIRFYRARDKVWFDAYEDHIEGLYMHINTNRGLVMYNYKFQEIKSVTRPKTNTIEIICNSGEKILVNFENDSSKVFKFIKAKIEQ